MSQLSLYLLSLFLSLSSAFTENIEKSFLQNDPHILFSLLPSEQPLNISLPQPISFSDQISSEQAFFLFKKIFQTYTTFEFFSEPGFLPSLEKGRYIFKARWSFLSKNRNQHVFMIFFYIRGRPGASKLSDFWKISEIKAEKL